MNFTALDWTIVVGYLVASVSVGLIGKRFVGSAEYCRISTNYDKLGNLFVKMGKSEEALAYYEANRAEIDRYIQENEDDD